MPKQVVAWKDVFMFDKTRYEADRKIRSDNSEYLLFELDGAFAPMLQAQMPTPSGKLYFTACHISAETEQDDSALAGKDNSCHLTLCFSNGSGDIVGRYHVYLDQKGEYSGQQFASGWDEAFNRHKEDIQKFIKAVIARDKLLDKLQGFFNSNHPSRSFERKERAAAVEVKADLIPRIGTEFVPWHLRMKQLQSHSKAQLSKIAATSMLGGRDKKPAKQGDGSKTRDLPAGIVAKPTQFVAKSRLPEQESAKKAALQSRVQFASHYARKPAGSMA
jgi:hypothetical protein